MRLNGKERRSEVVKTDVFEAEVFSEESHDGSSTFLFRVVRFFLADICGTRNVTTQPIERLKLRTKKDRFPNDLQ